MPPPRAVFPRFAAREGVTLSGRYALHEVLGEGASGIVFRATDLAVGEDVAVKVLAQEPSPRALARFTREARLGRRLAHPNIVRVHDFVHLEREGLYLLVMQWVDGVPLGRRVAEGGPLPRRALARVCEGLAAALAAAHRHGVVHRDVKPDNVLLTPTGAPLLLDFGAAHEAGAAALTAEGFSPGTPEFMAPEQLTGARVGPAADVYALGLTVAFAAGAALEDGRVGRLPRAVPEPVRRCLEPDPARRWPDAGALEVALRREGLRRRAFAGAALALLALGLLGAAAWALRPPPGPVRVMVGRGPGAAALALDELLTVSLTEASDGLVLGGAGPAGVTLLPALEGTAERPALALAAAGLGAPRALPGAGGGEDLFRQVDEAVRALRRELGLRPLDVAGAAALTTRDPDAWAHHAAALRALETHQRQEALQEARAAVAIDPGFVRAQLLVVVLTHADGLGSRAEAPAALAALGSRRARLHPLARELFEAVEQLVLSDTATGIARLRAYTERHAGDRFALWLATRLCSGAWTRERARFIDVWAAQLPRDAEPHNQRGYLLLSQSGDITGALHEFREAIRLAPGNPNGYDSLADALRRAGRLEDARGALREALRLDPSFVPALTRAAEYALAADDLREARRLLAEAEARIDPEQPAAERLIRTGAALRLVRGDAAGAVVYLRAWARAPRSAGKAYAARHLEAYALALDRRPEEAARALAQAEAAEVTYHAGHLPLPADYLEALAVREHPARLAQVLARMERARAAGSPSSPLGSEEVVRALLHLSRGEPARAVAVLQDAAPLAFGQRNFSGVSFVGSWLHGRALWRVGRLGEAHAAFAETLRRRTVFDMHPETAYFWPAFLEDAAALAALTGDEARAREYRAHRAALSAAP